METGHHQMIVKSSAFVPLLTLSIVGCSPEGTTTTDLTQSQYVEVKYYPDGYSCPPGILPLYVAFLADGSLKDFDGATVIDENEIPDLVRIAPSDKTSRRYLLLIAHD